MTMHLAHPALSTTGRRRGKQQFRNAEQAQLSRELSQDWEDLKKKWAVPQASKSVKVKSLQPCHKPSPPPGRESTRHIPSIDSGMGVASRKPTPQYTGSEMIGVTILHKSCLQPVFSAQEAKDAASMRR